MLYSDDPEPKHLVKTRAANLPCQSTYTPEGWISTGLSYADYGAMHLAKPRRSALCNRKLETPEWAVSDEKLRELVVVYLENRAQQGSVGTLFERLTRAKQAIAATTAHMEARATSLCSRYVEEKNEDPLQPYVKHLGVVIENIDTQIRLNNDIGAKVLSVVYLYYRCGMTSAQVGEELGLKPPHVRQILWRLARVWEEMQEPQRKHRNRIGPPVWHDKRGSVPCREKMRQSALRRWANYRAAKLDKTKAEAAAPAVKRRAA
jgi:hypothetical protein